MKRTITVYIFCIIGAISCSLANAATGKWNAYLAYHDIQQIVPAGDDVFVRASNNLFSYNQKDMSITVYDRTNGLNDTYITHMAWSKTARRLIAVYGNSNIDLIDVNGNVNNISALYAKPMTEDKTVNDIFIHGKHAYLATNFGAVKVDMDRAEISESYNIFGISMARIVVSGNRIYVKRKDNIVMSASMSDNLVDRNNWTVTQDYDASMFDIDTSDYDRLLPTVSKLNPGGPKYNNFGFMRIRNNKLYTVGCGYNILSDLMRPGTVQVLDRSDNMSDDWTIYQDDFGTDEHNYVDIMSVDVDPKDAGHVFACGRTGIYEFRNGRLEKEYTMDNSPIKSGLNSYNYNCVFTCAFDKGGTLWCLNSMAPGQSVIALQRDGNWTTHNKKELLDKNGISKTYMIKMFEDSRGLFWFNFDYWEKPAVFCYDPSTDGIKAFDRFYNQDGANIGSITTLPAITEDKEGNIWIGTNIGPIVIEKEDIFKDDYKFTQVKVPRNDGTNLADYLLAGIGIRDIVVDGANRKWFATDGNGVYLISEDNIEEIHHFTFDNSMLLSNTVESIAVNNSTGEVFMGTDKGLCSYMSDATTPSDDMTEDNVYAYPNPVTPDHTGLITVVGLSMNADVKITTANGAIVAQGRSNGGMFTWNGRDKDGRRVASGVYMVHTAKADGSKGTVCKIAIVN